MFEPLCWLRGIKTKYENTNRKKHQQYHRGDDTTSSEYHSYQQQLAIRRLELRQTIRIRHGLDTHEAPLARRRASLLGSREHPQCCSVLRIQDSSGIMRPGGLIEAITDYVTSCDCGQFHVMVASWQMTMAICQLVSPNIHCHQHQGGSYPPCSLRRGSLEKSQIDASTKKYLQYNKDFW